MSNNEFSMQTTLNGGIVTLTLDLTVPSYMDRLSGVYFEDTDITAILDKNTLNALDMEAEHAYSSDKFEDASDFNPSRDAFKLGE